MKHEGEFPEDEDTEDDPFAKDEAGDDDDLPAIDREIRINELKERARELGGGEMVHSTGDTPLDPRVEEQFWQQVVNFESSNWVTGLDKLQQIGVEMPDPEELPDDELPEKLREAIGAMASIRMFLLHTDHLSDRELYERLWDEILQEESPDMPMGDNGGWMLDMVGSGSDEDTEDYLRYYADEEYRARWKTDFPDEEIPEHVNPPYNRDKDLPSSGI